MVRRDVFNEGETESQIQQIERGNKNREKNPGAEIPDVQVGKDVRREQQSHDEGPRPAQNVEEGIRNEFFGELAQEGNLKRFGFEIVHESLADRADCFSGSMG